MKVLPFALIVTNMIVVALPALAAKDKPAVSEANGLAAVTFAAAGASGEGAGALLGGGQYTVPVGVSWGSRINLNAGLAFGNGTDAAEAVSGSLSGFWRDPETGFAELRAFGSHFSSVDLYGAEITGGRFRDDWDFDFGVGFLETPDGSAATAGGGIGQYTTDNFRWHVGVSGGAAFEGEASYGGEFSLQWQPPTLSRNLVFGIDAGGGSIGNVGFYQIGISAVLYFGEARSLRRKIREDW